MKTTYIIAVICSLFLSNCAHWYNATDSNYSKAIESSKPPHKGSYTSGTWGAWSYKAYAKSVFLKAPTGVMRYYEVEVFDIDSNGRFDTVFARFDGTWRFGSIREVRARYHMIDSGLPSGIVMEFINIATHIKKDIARRQAQERYRRMIIEETLREQTLHNTFNIYPEEKPKTECDWHDRVYE